MPNNCLPIFQVIAGGVRSSQLLTKLFYRSEHYVKETGRQLCGNKIKTVDVS